MKSLSEAVNDRLTAPAATTERCPFKFPKRYCEFASAFLMPERHELSDSLTAPVFHQRVCIFRMRGPVDPCLQFFLSEICFTVTTFLHPYQLRGVHITFLATGLMSDLYGSSISREVFLQFVGTVPNHMKLALKHLIWIRFPVTFRTSGTKEKSIRMDMEPLPAFPTLQFCNPVIHGMHDVSREKLGKRSRIIRLYLQCRLLKILVIMEQE